MKAIQWISVFGSVAAAATAFGQTADLAPASVNSMLFNGTITSSSGAANGSGSFTSVFTANGIDYTLAPGGSLSDGVAFTYTKNSATMATLTEPAVNGLPSTSVALTFTSANAGTFAATYGNGGSQQGTFTLAAVSVASALTNASTRTTLSANASAITGFVIGGTTAHHVLIRAVGPGLASFGVQSPLASPTITVWKGSQAVATNAGFDSGSNVDATLPQAFQQVGAFALKPGSKDSAVVVKLDPGAYTAQIRSSSATDTGEVLLEVYLLD